MVCDPLCNGCTGPSNTECNACVAGKYQLEGSSYTCVSACSDIAPNYYLDGSLCKPCNSFCATCTGPEEYDCTSCEASAIEYVDSTVKNPKHCTNQCGTSRYHDTVNKKCYDCAADCHTCGGTAVADCTYCMSGYFFNPPPRPVSLLASVPYSPMLSLVPVILVIRLAPPVSPQPPTAMPVPPSTSLILVPFLLLAVLATLLVMNALQPETLIVKPVPPITTQLTNFPTSVWLPAQTMPITSTSMELSVRSARVSAALAPAPSTPTVTPVLSPTTKL